MDLGESFSPTSLRNSPAGNSRIEHSTSTLAESSSSSSKASKTSVTVRYAANSRDRCLAGLILSD
jgi:hypothetical protein